MSQASREGSRPMCLLPHWQSDMDIFFYSIFIFFVTYWIPGWLILRWAKTPGLIRLLLAIPLGIALWGWQGWIFGWLHIPWASYGYLTLFFVWFLNTVFHTPSMFRKLGDTIRPLQKDTLSLVILIVGVSCQSLILWNVLQQINGSWVSCCGDTNDNIWYASITKSIIESFPPQYPGITGQTLHNYHYWSNLIIADIVRIFHVDQFLIQFRYSGVLLSASLGLVLIALSGQLLASAVFTRWVLLFFYFGGDMIYLISLLQQRIFGFPGSSLEDGVRFLSNPPRSYAVVLALSWITLFSLWRGRLDWKKILVLSLIIAATVGLKIYLAFFLLTGLAAVVIYDLFHRRRESLVLIAVSLLISALVYLPVNSQAGGLYFTGFWRFENFISQPDFSLIRLDMARAIFAADNKVFKALFYDLLFMSIYTICIFGTKLVGVLPILAPKNGLPLFMHIFLVSSLSVHFIIGAFFQQSTGGSNTFNFHVNVYLFLSFYAALAMTRLGDILSKRRALYSVISLAVILLTVPRAIFEMNAHIQRVRDLYAIVPNSVQQIVDYLKNTPESTIIAVRSGNIAPDQNGPYMYLFTGKHQYLSAPVLLTQFGADTFDRERNLTAITGGGFPNGIRKILKHEKIDYLVLDTARAIQATKSSYWLVPVVQTEPVTLMKIDLERPPPPPVGL